ncbi:GvpL/GvpF family gas vesicle protein [Nonomuraea mesophila]|uniref:GvpL/GvpF family gas vesicle protein n=1 Tax=Nonomuraea mesophila TaxID=2530382 RepID=A0A4R5EJW7_9ACTN|nr:GvpL/GvpF family gas vesicle protein [Nonomuraea mesophila]TDE34754.1 GvpL/GvpF family gas vesicle protein [Nonomuraea mesophila]
MSTSETTDRHKPSEDGQRSDTRVGTYVYGIVPANVEETGDAHGVGGPSAEVTVVRHGDIAALVSELRLDRPLGTPEDLMAHEGLLDAAAAEVPVLPVRFGAVVTGPEAVVEELLAPHHDEFQAALDELEGRAEYVVKGRYVERAVLSEIMNEHPQVAQLREQIKDQPEEVTRDARIQIGEIVDQAINAKREADTQAALDAVTPVSALTSLRDPSHELDAVHLAVLVETDRQNELEQALDTIAQRWAGRVELRLLGPMAAYDFIVAQGSGGG